MVITTTELNGWTYKQVLEGMLEWMIFAQNKNECDIGGWGYVSPGEQGFEYADNSNSGYATLGIGLAAAAPPDGFGLTIPQTVLDNLNLFINNVQVNDYLLNTKYPGLSAEFRGGSIYNPCVDFFFYITNINILKAGNLLYELALVGAIDTNQRVLDAITFIEKFWNSPGGQCNGCGWKGEYQAMFTLMKGLQAYGIETLTIDVNNNDQEIDWFYDEDYGVASYIVDNQNEIDGSWLHTQGEGTPATLDTAWALLTLERVVPTPPSTDNEGPKTSNVEAAPIAVGTQVTLTAIVDDTDTGGSNIASAEYNLDNDTSWIPMDTSFNSPTEDVTAIFNAPAEAGIYDLCVRGTDEHDNTGDPECIMLAAYDPAGGFVTGGGWIWSPEGAYMADPILEGKANFGFVSKYKKGAAVPTGETEFQFKAGNLNFHSDSYDWLVIAGHKAKYKGTGTINGAGNYGFMLSAIDEKLTPSTDVDLFRIKIWDKDDGDAVVYDNQMDDGEDLDPTTAIGGGSIVIHKSKK